MDKPLCVVCNRRVAQFLRDNEHAPYKLCKPCNTLLRAEKSWKKYGLRRPKVQWLTDQQLVVAYNRLAKRGLLLCDIAERLGMAEQSLKNRKVLLAKAGYELERPKGQTKHHLQPSEPVDRSTMNARVNEHGGGKCGIDGCNCALCLERRRTYRREWNAANPEKVKGFRKKADVKRKRYSKPKPS